jgi:hypothetical protein
VWCISGEDAASRTLFGTSSPSVPFACHPAMPRSPNAHLILGTCALDLNANDANRICLSQPAGIVSE